MIYCIKIAASIYFYLASLFADLVCVILRKMKVGLTCFTFYFVSLIYDIQIVSYMPTVRTKFSKIHYQNNINHNNFHGSYKIPSVLQMSSKDSSDSNPYYRGMDAYQILECQRTADKKEIKSAYRKCVAKWHPDKFPDDEEKKKEGNLRMEKINRAWFCLEDDDRRRRYDQFGEQGVGTSAASEDQLKQGGGPNVGFGGAGGAVDVGDISDIFDAFFGGGVGGARGRTSSQQRRNVNAPVQGKFVYGFIEVKIYYLMYVL